MFILRVIAFDFGTLVFQPGIPPLLRADSITDHLLRKAYFQKQQTHRNFFHPAHVAVRIFLFTPAAGRLRFVTGKYRVVHHSGHHYDSHQKGKLVQRPGLKTEQLV